jgi:YHS domain-containing protein
MSMKSKMPKGALDQVLASITCPVCGNKFVTAYPMIYAYKITDKKGKCKYFCRYTCMRTFQRQQREAKKE